MQGIVLSRRDFREFDQIISLYIKDKGRLELLARGVKKITSKNAAHLEPFSFVMVEMVSGSEIGHLIKVVPIDLFANVRSNLDKSLAASYAVSFLNKVTAVGQPDQKIWILLLEWLEYLDGNDFACLLVDGFIISLLRCLGIAPVLDRCVTCEENYAAIAKNELSGAVRVKAGVCFAEGGLLCPACRVRYTDGKVAECGMKDINNMRLLLKGDWRLISEFNLNRDEEDKLHELIYDYVLYYNEKKIADWRHISRGLGQVSN